LIERNFPQRKLFKRLMKRYTAFRVRSAVSPVLHGISGVAAQQASNTGALNETKAQHDSRMAWWREAI